MMTGFIIFCFAILLIGVSVPLLMRFCDWLEKRAEKGISEE